MLWDCKYSIKATMNQETGKILPLPYRMYFFVPMNIPIAFGLLCLPATSTNIMFFNFMNQTYNASMNYMNSSGTSDSKRLLFFSYFCALASSIGSGLVFRKLLKPKKKVNIIKELMIRILRLSKICGLKAILEGGMTRFFLPIPLIVQFLICNRLRNTNISKRALLASELFLCSVALGFGLPLSIAIFRQYSKINVSKIEKEYSNLQDSNNKMIQYVYYNKGL